MKKISLSEISFKNMISDMVFETITRVLNENYETPEDKFNREQEYEEEMSYEMGEFLKALRKANGTYKAKSKNGSFQTGDRVIVHTKKGDIQGVITDFDMNYMTYEETADVDYDENGTTKTLLCCPLNKIEKVD